MPTTIPILVDASVIAQDELSMGSGVRGVAIMLTRDALMAALGDVTVGTFGSG
jgi:prolyl-tRNA editing enzyme YbaK/EbsC (Cys-tRNA(Pro) deacylase)